MRFRTPFPPWGRRPGTRGWAVAAAAAAALALVVAIAAAIVVAAVPAAGTRGQAAGVHAANAALARPLPPVPVQMAPRTSCQAVAHIGDSTSVGLADPAILPDPAQRLQARYAAVGVRHVLADASGGRAIVEELPGQLNGYLTARRIAAGGFHGCWVIALGTNDAANVAAGSPVGPAARIGQMMSAAHGQPVLWVNVKTLASAGAWSEPGMQQWNTALRRACARYPNLRVFDWASVAQPGWFTPDGIHYTAAGYAARAQAIARALATAFPLNGQSRSCLVR